MDEETKKSNSRKRSKVISSESEPRDNETISSLFKLKNKKNPKKVKAGLGSSDEKEKEAALVEEDLGGLDDTLASLRKRLKGPKKSGVSDLSGVLLNDFGNEGVFGIGLKKVDEGGLNVGNDDEVENKQKAKVSKSVKSVKKNKDNGSQGSKLKLAQGENVADPDLDDKLEDSLSVFLRKGQSGSSKKSGIGSKTKSRSKTKNGESSNDDTQRSLSPSVLSQLISTDLTRSDEKIELLKCNDGDVKDHLTPIGMDVRVVSCDDKDPDSSFVSSIKRSEFRLNGCSQNILERDEGVSNKETDEIWGQLEHACAEHLQKGKSEELHSVKLENTDISAQIQEKIAVDQCNDGQTKDFLTPLEIDMKLVSSDEKNHEVDLICSVGKPEFGLIGCSHDSEQSDHNCSKHIQNGNSEELLSVKLENDCSLLCPELTLTKNDTFGDDDDVPNICDINDDVSIGTTKANVASSPSISPDRNCNHEERRGLLPVIKSKDKKLSEIIKRKSKKRRHEDMAYDDDVDWSVLMHEQRFAQENVEDDDITLRENVGAAAVSAGLKARDVGLIEKIKFKDVLKRKGGPQEYLKCRNQILALWSKDVTRVLPLSKCGVTASPSIDEHPHNSLVREIYEFLNRSGYINVGIASERDITEVDTSPNLKLVEEKTFGEIDDLAPDVDDGVSFILGQVTQPKASVTALNNNVVDDKIHIEVATVEKKLIAPDSMKLSIFESDQCQTEEVHDNEGDSFMETKLKTDFCDVQPSSSNAREGKRIIVIGAGPAGLTAARHLQRHGFSVDVLEARDRVGGRVYTDRSSLSVPVDLGASIITGVEADIATERRADPSSLICAQLGLELTVLKSDCPLYDVVTGQKVPVDLDEALEAEYNTLLDEMLLLVAQKGEKAMKMSLEDGLEYALKGRRMAPSGKNYIKGESSTKDDVLSPLERRVMNWHFAHLEYGCAALLQDVSLPYWNQDDIYGGFGGAHCMIKGGYSAVVESLGQELNIHLNHIVTNISYPKKECKENDGGKMVKVRTSNGKEFSGDGVLITVPLGCLKARDIDFSPPLPHWKELSIQRLGFGVLNKVVMEFHEIFWDESVDYFGATAEETDLRGKCFMFWNVKKTVGAPVLIALVVGKAAIEGQKIDSSDDLINHALAVLRKLFGKNMVPNPVASVVTDWGNDPFSYGAYSYVAIGASGEDYDILGKPVENCLFFAGEATCKEYPDTVGGAMLSGLREAVRIIDLMIIGNDYSEEIEEMEAVQRRSDSERNEVRDIAKRLEAIELSNAMYRKTLDGARNFTRKSLLKDMFYCAKTTAGRLILAKELLNLPVESLKSFGGTKAGLSILNTWILDSMGKDGTQLLRHCVRLLVLVSTDLLAVRLSGVGKTIKEKVCIHTSRDIRAIASQLVNVWIEVFRKEKASNNGLKLLRQPNSLKTRSLGSGKVQPRAHGLPDNKRSHLPPRVDSIQKLTSHGSVGEEDPNIEDHNSIMSEEEKAVFAAAEAARTAALAAAEAYASSEAKCNTALPLPKIPSFHKFARREQYTHIDEFDVRRKMSGGTVGKQDCISETDSKNCRVRDWPVTFSAASTGLENNKKSIDTYEHSAENTAVDSSVYTKAWVDGCGCEGLKDYNAIDRWQSQAAAAEPEFFQEDDVVWDDEDSNVKSEPPLDRHEGVVNESSASQVTINRDSVKDQPRGVERIKKAVLDFVASLLMPLYKAKKFDKEGYKSIMKKTSTKVMEQITDAEKAMALYEFLDFKRKNKIRAFVDKLIEKHMRMRPVVKP